MADDRTSLRSLYSTGDKPCTVWVSIRVHIGATLNRPCAAAMRPCQITLTTCYCIVLYCIVSHYITFLFYFIVRWIIYAFSSHVHNDRPILLQ